MMVGYIYLRYIKLHGYFSMMNIVLNGRFAIKK